jgi:hypothetical protein
LFCFSSSSSAGSWLYNVGDISVPVAFEPVRKSIRCCELKTRREKRRAEVTKSGRMRSLIDVCANKPINFKWVLFDTWFGSAEKMRHIKIMHGKDFVGSLKVGRLVALSEEDRKKRRFIRVDQIEWRYGDAVAGWPKGPGLSRPAGAPSLYKQRKTEASASHVSPAAIQTGSAPGLRTGRRAVRFSGRS